MPQGEWQDRQGDKAGVAAMTPRAPDLNERADAAPSSRSYVTECDDYSRTVRGIDIEVIRVGGEASPTEIRSSAAPDWVATSMSIGFSVLSRTALPRDQIGVGVIEDAPPGTRWCGIDLERGDVVVYGPEAEHVAVNPAGMRFSFAVISTDDLARASDRLGVQANVPKGSVERMPVSAATRRIRNLIPTLPVRGSGTDAARVLRGPQLLTAMSDALATTYGDRSVSRRLSDARIVLACIEYAELAQRIPTMVELGSAAHVSERRMRTAFRLTHDMAPHQFFLLWGLDLARRRLITSEPGAVTVAWVACGAGFMHLGRFARYYKAQYGESPSVTLRRDLQGERT